MSHVIHYLTRRTGGGSSSIGNIGGTALSNGLSELVLQSNPMLEAFGNAYAAHFFGALYPATSRAAHCSA